jgi:small-conductance mechanosensitive channel
MVDSLYDRTYYALVSIWPGLIENIIAVLATLIVALIVLLVGWIVAVVIGSIITQILNAIKLNQYFERMGWRKSLEAAEIKVDASAFIGGIFKWLSFVIVLMIVADVLGLDQFAGLLQGVIGYLPNVIVAVFLFVAAVIISDILEKVVRAAVEGTKVGYGAWAAVIVKWSIWVFAILAILEQLGVAQGLIQTLYTGVVAFLVIALGIAFGLGGKDVAAEILKDLKHKLLS